MKIYFSGADDQNRTGDLLITNQLLYRLSYIGIHPLIDIPARDTTFILWGIACQVFT